MAAGPPADDPGGSGVRAADKELSHIVTAPWNAREALRRTSEQGGGKPHRVHAAQTG